ncbi:MAG: hypothetical protein HYT63_00660 [Candidatus Yanofskybacteria bacterium]|nr:hypothetical protein [Candidatus Yanofskybacteria bacterium]
MKVKIFSQAKYTNKVDDKESLERAIQEYLDEKSIKEIAKIAQSSNDIGYVTITLIHP